MLSLSNGTTFVNLPDFMTSFSGGTASAEVYKVTEAFVQVHVLDHFWF